MGEPLPPTVMNLKCITIPTRLYKALQYAQTSCQPFALFKGAGRILWKSKRMCDFPVDCMRGIKLAGVVPLGSKDPLETLVEQAGVQFRPQPMDPSCHCILALSMFGVLFWYINQIKDVVKRIWTNRVSHLIVVTVCVCLTYLFLRARLRRHSWRNLMAD